MRWGPVRVGSCLHGWEVVLPNLLGENQDVAVEKIEHHHREGDEDVVDRDVARVVGAGADVLPEAAGQPEVVHASMQHGFDGGGVGHERILLQVPQGDRRAAVRLE